MIKIRKSLERGYFDHGWLKTWHSFSFAEYSDPDHMGLGEMRVLNEDIIAPGQGFGMHPHREMEIVTYVLSGALEHRDSLGSSSVIMRGDVQRISAGTGVLHSEFNPSPGDPVRLLQIWIKPRSAGIAPGYEQRHFPLEEKRGGLRLIVSPDGAQDSLRMSQDCRVYASVLGEAEKVEYLLAPGRRAWIQVASGRLLLCDQRLAAGDGAAVTDLDRLDLRSLEATEFLLLDLP